MNDHQPAIPLDDQLCFGIYSASIAVQRLYKPLLDELGITYTQYLVLCTLWENGGLSVGAVGHRLALEPSTITPAVKRLEAAGFVTRRRSATDERQTIVELTAEGAALRPRTRRLNDALLRRSGLDVPGMVALNTAIRDLTGHLREPDTGSSERSTPE